MVFTHFISNFILHIKTLGFREVRLLMIKLGLESNSLYRLTK